MLLSLILILNLILIPKIDVQAANYPATTSFTYNYQGYDYQFYFSGEVDSPQDYRFDDSVLDFVIQKSGEGLNLAIAAETTANINFSNSPFLFIVYSLYHNWMIATSWFQSPWLDSSKLYGFSFEFTGVDYDYPGSGEYGPAYGWRFIGWASECLDLVLDEQGFLYGTHAIGNYTFSDDQRDFGIWSIHQYEAGDGEFLVPEVNVTTFGDLKPPYFEGNTLVFFAYNNGLEHKCTIPNFERCLCVYQPWTVTGQTYYPGHIGFIDYQVNGSISNSNRLYIDGALNGLGKQGRNVTFTYKGLYRYQNYMILYNFNDWQLDVNLPMYQPSSFQATNFNTIINGNVKGILSSQPQYATCELLYLDILTTSPLPDPIVLPVDDPIPVSNIDPDPVVFDPDPGEDPDPVPGIDYPDPGPVPFPVPPLPSLISGNDELWPDVNGVLAVENDLDSYLGVLGNFEFTPLQSLVEGFVAGLTWVSMVMMTLYNGSDFSVLFVVLSMFFIAACLLGVYKWWTH